MRRSLLLCAQAGNTLFFVGVEGRAQSKVEANFGVFAVKLTLLNQLTIGDFNRVGNQAIAGGEGKVIPQILITVKVNLAG